MASAFSPTRDGSCDRSESRMIRHQHSFSESGRASVPMWDSSDPDRAPPPLPLNPAVPGSPVTRPNTSARIEEAAALITARARENAPSTYTINPAPATSPDKSIIKPQHKRMQTIQTGNIGRLSDSLERRSPDKGLRTSKLAEYDDYRRSRSLERSPSTRLGSETPTPTSRTSKSFEQENTPPSSTMLALQAARNRQEEPILTDITNGSSQPTLNFGALSSQILKLTDIAAKLQVEMSGLSKRSKDNATDLSKLKEATNTRDEDIRKSLLDLKSGLEGKFSSLDSRLLDRSGSSLGLYLDSKAHDGSPAPKGFGTPRIASPSGFSAALDRALTASPSMVSADGAASIALLEKVLREMATRDGQDRIIMTLESAKAKALDDSRSPFLASKPIIDHSMMKKLEEVLFMIKELKEDTSSKALIRAGQDGPGRSSQLDAFLEESSRPGPLTKARADEARLASDGLAEHAALSEELMKMLKSVKQSLSQGGGLTNEVKALVRELRGEVLGMGRELARRLDKADAESQSTTSGRQNTNEDLIQTVEQTLADFKEQMQLSLNEELSRAVTTPQPAVDTTQLLHAVQQAMTRIPQHQENPRDLAAEKQELMVSIRDAWEECKPEVTLEHFGLERDEVLETVKEGMQLYQTQNSTTSTSSITYDVVLDAVRRGLEDFKIPVNQQQATILTPEDVLEAIRTGLQEHDHSRSSPAVSGAGLSHEDVLDAVRTGLQEAEHTRSLPSVHTAVTEGPLTRDDVVAAVQEGFGNMPSALSTRELNRDDILATLQEGLSEHAHVAKEVEFNREDLFDAVKSCLEGEQNPLGGMGERVVEAMHEFLDSMKKEFAEYSAANGKDTEQVLDAMKDGLENLRGDIESYVDRASDVTGKDEIIDTVKAGFAALQHDLEAISGDRKAQPVPTTPELLDAMEKEFEHLRDTISKSLTRNDMSSDREEILDAIRDISDDRQSALSTNSQDIVRLVKDELEHMRTALAGNLVKTGAGVDREDILDAIREGLESQRTGPRGDGTESLLSNTSELLDAFQEGVDGIRADMQKLLNKPAEVADVSTNYEILDTLKAGLEELRADIERLSVKQNDSFDSATARGQEVVVHDTNDTNTISAQIEALKVMITQLRIKIEARDDMPPPEAFNVAKEMRVHPEDMDNIYTAIRDVHDTVKASKPEIPEIRLPEVQMPPDAARKDDTDAIETLLRNVKAHLDEFLVPNTLSAIHSEQLESIEGTLKELSESLEESLSNHGKSVDVSDIANLELAIKDLSSKTESLHQKFSGLNDDDSKATKTDLEIIQSLCLDLKNQLDTLEKPDFADLAKKDDVAQIQESVQAFRERLEADNELAGQAFEARKIEHNGLATKIDDVRALIGDLRDEVVAKVDGSAEGIDELNKVVGMHHEEISKAATAEGLSNFSNQLTKELERHMQHHLNFKTEAEERDATLFTKHDEANADLKGQIEESFNELMVKYDDAQASNSKKLEALAERDQAHLDATSGTKNLVDELKVVMDTLGATVTDTRDRVSEDSKTLFVSVEEANSKMGEIHASNAHEHGMTREEVSKTLASTTRVENSLQEHQPAVMTAIREVFDAVGQLFAHSQQQTENFARVIDEIKTGVDSIPSAIPPLLPALPAEPSTPPLVREVPVQSEYDDSQVHDKLNNLISHATIAKEAFAKLEGHHEAHQDALSSLAKIDEIHEKVTASADELSAMIVAQSKLMNEHNESKAAEATQAAIALEKRTAQKEKVEADIVALNAEKEALVLSMAELKAEQSQLINQTKHLGREVAKLETALSIRHEEMKEMNSRAETLERRILEGVMNHARSVKISKLPQRGPVTAVERDRAMSLKRVPSTASGATAKVTSKDHQSTLGSTVSMALKKRGPLTSTVSAVSSRNSGVDRRILSTSHVTGNRGRETPDRSIVIAPAPKNGLVSLKRSHSVKSNTSAYLNGRKPSWNALDSAHADKENYADPEQNEDDMDLNSSDVETYDDIADRRTSSDGTSYMYTDSLAYGTGSSLSTSSNNRTASYASSVGGTLNGQTESIAEEDDEDEAQTPVGEDNQSNELVHVETAIKHLPEETETPDEADMGMTLYEGALDQHAAGQDKKHDPAAHYPPSDSGLGSEPSWTPLINTQQFEMNPISEVGRES